MLLIGIGNEFRGDDAIGILAIESLKSKHPNLGEFIIEQSDLSRLLSIWKEKDLIIIDAIRSKQMEVGSIFATSSIDEIIQMSDVLFSTHGIDLSNVLAMGESINRMPRTVFFVGINGENWEMGDSISAEVKSALIPLEEKILEYQSEILQLHVED